jgi:hypothetical protein
MNPTLTAGDELQLEPYNCKKIRVGDVVVFNVPEDGRKITHRVISVNSKGVRTLGDNNKIIDAWVLTTENIIGRVVYAQRGRRRRRVFGGSIGRFYVIVVRLMKMLVSGIAVLLRPVYRWMVQTGFIIRLFSGQIKPLIITLNRQEGTELQLLVGRRFVGRLLPGESQWQIRRPFRLFLDETSLPKGT